MNARALKARLTPLFESLKQTQHLITRLSKLSAQPSSDRLNPDEENDVRLELSADIHQNLKEQEEDFELLRQEAEDQANHTHWGSGVGRRDSVRERERTDLAAQVARLGEDLKISRAQFRKAQLQAKRNVEAAKRKERELLFAGIEEGGSSTTSSYGRRKEHEKLSQDEILVNASSDVTAALRRTHNLMTSELERSRFAQETLENSTRDLTTLSESYNNLDTLLSNSRSLVSSLITSQKSDTWYLESAFYILIATIAWLIFRRLIYGPGWWLLYLPTRWLWRLALFSVQFLAGTFSIAAGAVGAKNQSVALSQASASISTSVAQIPTGLGKIPKRVPGQPAPSIRVGAGGHGAKMQHPEYHVQQSSRQAEGKKTENLSDQIGEMAEESKLEEKALSKEETEQVEKTSGVKGQGQEQEQVQKGTALLERTEEDGPPNPKKRMWEEPMDRSQEQHLRDEL